MVDTIVTPTEISAIALTSSPITIQGSMVLEAASLAVKAASVAPEVSANLVVDLESAGGHQWVAAAECAAAEVIVFGGIWKALTLFARSVAIRLGCRSGVRGHELLRLEDDSGYWCFEDGSRIGIDLGLELTERPIDLTLLVR